ncbi:MAG: Nif3-like dinuclear metal center hexameric protein [Planctomycetota bacterium]
MPPTVADLAAVLNDIAPLDGAEPWDKVGLHVGDESAQLSGPALLTIDLTEPVVDEAINMRASAIVAYHPPIWEPIERLTGSTRTARIVAKAIAHGIAIHSPHTALDNAEGGVTDWLCEGLAGLAEGESPGGRIQGDVRGLEPHPVHKASQEVKIVTFVPDSAVEQVRNALATAGAGRIGDYEVCSFSLVGKGTFFAGGSTNPAVGSKHKLETVDEHRLEMVCSKSGLPLAIETLRQFHPYEEPAYDIYELIPEPRRSTGAGRRLVLDQPATLAELGRRLRTHLGRARIKLALVEPDNDKPITHLGVCPGAGSSLVELATREGCEAFVTGEMKHHEILASLDRGTSLLLAGHTNTERGYLPRLASKVSAQLPALTIAISNADRDPLTVLTD